MTRKPMGPTAHGAVDYLFAALNASAPTLFGLRGPARAICYGFAASQGLLNALPITASGCGSWFPCVSTASWRRRTSPRSCCCRG